MFNTKGQELNNAPKTFGMGVHYAKVSKVEVKTSGSGKKALNLVLESEPMPEGFEGVAINREDKEGPKYKGQVAFVQGTNWLSQEDFSVSDVKKNEILNKMLTFGKELGIKDKMDEINAESLEDWVAQAHDMIKSDYLYFFLAGEENEYNDKVNIKLRLPKFKFAARDKSNLEEFDKTNKYHFRPLDKGETVSEFEGQAAGSTPSTDFEFPVG